MKTVGYIQFSLSKGQPTLKDELNIFKLQLQNQEDRPRIFEFHQLSPKGSSSISSPMETYIEHFSQPKGRPT